MLFTLTDYIAGSSDGNHSPRIAKAEPQVFLIGSDPQLGGWVSGLVGSVGGRVHRYSSHGQFLAEVVDNQYGGVVMEVPPGEAGTRVRLLRDRGYRQPIIALADDGTITDAVSAIKAGACEFLLKPPNGQELLEILQAAWRSELERADRDRQVSSWRNRFSVLSRREHEVLRLIIHGLVSKEIADQLGISARTVDAHRSAILRKLGGDRISELVGMYMLIHHNIEDPEFLPEAVDGLKFSGMPRPDQAI